MDIITLWVFPFCSEGNEQIDSGNIIDEQSSDTESSAEISEDDSAAKDPDFICEPDELADLENVDNGHS